MSVSRFLQPLAYAFQKAEIAHRTIAEKINQILNNFGQRVIPAFSAANFSANGSMTWTVIAGGVTTYSYTLVGRTMVFSFSVSGTVGGTPNTLLQIAIPDGYVASQAMASPMTITNGGATSISQASVAASGAVLRIAANPAGSANWTAGTASVQGQLMLQVT
jgi:hypothetical protein